MILTKEKTAKPDQRSSASMPATTANVDHSVFKEGQGLLDMMSSPTMDAAPVKNNKPETSSIMQRMQAEEKHEQAVNEVMEEIED